MWLLVLISIVPTEYVVCDSVDGIEVNSYIDFANREVVFEQIVFYDFNPRNNRFDVVDWRLLRFCSELSGTTPLPRRVGNRYVSEWFDEKSVCQRRVTSIWYWRSRTYYDPELKDREFLPTEKRRLLTPK